MFHIGKRYWGMPGEFVIYNKQQTACTIRMGGFFIMWESRADVHAGKGCPIGTAMTFFITSGKNIWEG